MKKNYKKLVSILIIIIIVVVCFIYLYSKGTYTIYESQVGGDINPNIAKWNIMVNDTIITTKEITAVDISNINWITDHVAPNKAAPGSRGILDINVDPLDTDVSIRYDIEIIDKTVDSEKILTVNSVTDTLNKLVRTDVNTYTGIITLDDINSGNINNIKLDIEWVDNGEEIDFDVENAIKRDYLIINFKAVQYNGEKIVPYTLVGD